jgi:hypothetical protein
MKRTFRACDGRKITVTVTPGELLDRIMFCVCVFGMMLAFMVVCVIASGLKFF